MVVFSTEAEKKKIALVSSMPPFPSTCKITYILASLPRTGQNKGETGLPSKSKNPTHSPSGYACQSKSIGLMLPVRASKPSCPKGKTRINKTSKKITPEERDNSGIRK